MSTEEIMKTDDSRARQAVLDTLAEIGQVVVKDDGLVYQGSKFVLPATYDGSGGIDQAIMFLREYRDQQETEFMFDRQFNYRPDDGAYAFELAMKEVFGTAGIGKATQTMFGDIPPRYKTINISATETAQVPDGQVKLGALDATFYLNSSRHPEFGPVFHLIAEAPRKYRAHVEAFFRVVERKLKANSIYRGKAITGAIQPGYLDNNMVDPNKVIYSQEVVTQLDTNLWSLIRYTNQMRANSIPLKRAVLVEGPFGTGKTLAGQLTAQMAATNGWTFILARPGKDDLMQVLQTAQLYQPAVVWYEDIDVVGRGHSDAQVSELLDALDGITAKGAAVLAAFTSNHADKIQKGMLRPGRIDAVIHIEQLDDEGLIKLIKSTIPAAQLDDGIDWNTVVRAFHGMLPAFAKEAADRAMRYSITRNAGQIGLITDEDLVHAANGLRPQLELMEGAKEGVQQATLDTAISQVVTRVVDQTKIYEGDRQVGENWHLRTNGVSAPANA